LPRGGTLVIVGTYVQLGAWLAYSRPARVILICNYPAPALLLSIHAQLRQATGTEPEVVYVSSRLRDGNGIAGTLCPPLVDLSKFVPPPEPASASHGPLRIGRLSRDTPEKHHLEDPSLYRILAWEGFHVRVMGGTCLAPALAGNANVELLQAGAQPAQEFLQALDVFLYRTSPDWPEASGRVIIEAMACGLPVIAHSSGGYTDWIRHEENGLLFTTQEEALLALRRLKADRELRHRMGQEARLTAERHAGRAAVQNYASWLIGEGAHG
jgi:glycosyltransferase involved in cell wall biosynthesis